jgi:hypothetical protein
MIEMGEDHTIEEEDPGNEMEEARKTEREDRMYLRELKIHKSQCVNLHLSHHHQHPRANAEVAKDPQSLHHFHFHGNCRRDGWLHLHQVWKTPRRRSRAAGREADCIMPPPAQLPPASKSTRFKYKLTEAYCYTTGLLLHLSLFLYVSCTKLMN